MEDKKFKLITAIDRINYFSDNFISYYKKWFLDEEFHFMVHDKNYDIIRDYLFSKGFKENNIERYNIMTFGEGHNVGNQNRIKTRFIDEGRIVVYADIDERIYHPNLREYILCSEKTYILPSGMQIVHANHEPPLDFTKGVLEQRSMCVLDDFWYSKMCILKSDFRWDHGRHNKPLNKPSDSKIHLIDIGKVCREFMIENNKISAEIYNRVMWRYKETNKDHIEREIYKKIMLNACPIIESVKNSKAF